MNKFVLKTRQTIQSCLSQFVKLHSLLDGPLFYLTVIMIINTTSVWASHADQGVECLTEQKGAFEVSQITG